MSSHVLSAAHKQLPRRCNTACSTFMAAATCTPAPCAMLSTARAAPSQPSHGHGAWQCPAGCPLQHQPHAQRPGQLHTAATAAGAPCSPFGPRCAAPSGRICSPLPTGASRHGRHLHCIHPCADRRCQPSQALAPCCHSSTWPQHAASTTPHSPAQRARQQQTGNRKQLLWNLQQPLTANTHR